MPKSIAEIVAAHPNLDIHAFENQSKGVVILETLRARKDAPKGTGTAFMEDLVKWADESGKDIAIQTGIREETDPNSKYKKTSSMARLQKFYGRFGFKSNYGRRTYRPDMPGNMHRIADPSKKVASVSLPAEISLQSPQFSADGRTR